MKITIDGKKVELQGKKTILEVARENGIYIPSLCDHHRLSPFAGCRICIVQIKGKKGFPPSCSTYAEEGMEVKTKTPSIQKLRREILELILSEHPNACLICSEKENCDEYKSTIRKVEEVTGCVLCPNNNRCELQDVVEALKVNKVRFPSLYRNFEVKKSDPFFDRDYNLCILCGRCVRVCHEVRGASTLSFVYRGSQAVVGTVLDRPHLESGCQFCGACVDVCPTGALTERAMKYESLPEETEKTICPLCSMGCELEVSLKKGKILSSKPSEEGAVNQGQACVKGRFVIRDLVYSPRRILKPLIRIRKELEEVSWEEALNFAAQRLKKYKGREVAFIGSSQVACEESFLFQKFAREVLKTENIISPASFSPFAACLEQAKKNGLRPNLNFRIEDISKAKALFLIGADLPVSHPIIWLEVLKAVKEGAKLIVVSPIEFSLNRYASIWLRIKPGTEYYLLRFLSKILLEKKNNRELSQIEGFDSVKKSLDGLDLSQVFKITGITEKELKETSQFLLEAGSVAFLLGMGLTKNSGSAQSLSAIWNLACMREAQLFPLGLENNVRGVLETEQNFSSKGLTLKQIIQAASSGSIKALYLAAPIPYLTEVGLRFLVLQDSFVNDNFKFADAVLPATTFAETEGIFINTEGRVQKFKKLVEPLGEAKPDWWIISQLAQKMGKVSFNYKDLQGIIKEMNKVIPSFSKISYAKLEGNKEVFVHEEKKGEKKFFPLKYSHSPVETSKKYPFLLYIDYNLDYYRNLSLCQEIRGLKMIRDSRWIRISPEDAKKMKLKEGESIVVESSSGKIKGIVKIVEFLPKGVIGASFLWNEDSDFSVAGLVSTIETETHSFGMLPVKIKRGK